MARTLLRTITAAAFAAVIVVCLGFTVAGGWAAEPCTGTAAECARGGLNTTGSRAGLDTTSTSLPEIIGRFIYAALSLTGVIFVILLVYAGILWMQARGKTEDIEKAKKIIENAIIGIIITGLAFAITSFVINRIVEAQTGTAIDAGSAVPANDEAPA